MATIHDVARRAGVSTKTVSRYLSGFKGISERTVNAIEQASKELEFFPSAAARSLRGEPSGLVALITDNLITTPFSYEIVKGIESVCVKQGKLLLIGETLDDPHTFRKLVERFREQRVEAIVKATFFHKAISIEQEFKHCPLVLVNCFDEKGKHPAIVPDDKQGTYDLTNHLISRGHRNIAHISLPDDMVACGLRLQGFTRAMQEANLAINPDWMIPSIRRRPPETLAWLRDTLEQLLAPKRRPTAIMCGNDKMAFRVIMQLRAMQASIPEDISVVGFDDFKLLSESTVPTLTTVSLPYYRMGERAMNLALQMSGGNPAPKRRLVRCKCKVVPRDSDRTIRRKSAALEQLAN